jgi:hypothetical protein
MRIAQLGFASSSGKHGIFYEVRSPHLPLTAMERVSSLS